MSDAKDKDAAPKKKGGFMKMLVMGLGGLLLIGGGVGAGLYFGGAMGSAAAEPRGPKLLPKSEQKRGGGDGKDGDASADKKDWSGNGGDKYASTYYAMDKDFTSNLRDSTHFLQVGVAVSTPYDASVIANIKTHEIAVRSAILLALGDTAEDEVFTAEGKARLQKRLAAAINGVLQQKEGFGGVSNVYFTNFIVQ